MMILKNLQKLLVAVKSFTNKNNFITLVYRRWLLVIHLPG